MGCCFGKNDQLAYEQQIDELQAQVKKTDTALQKSRSNQREACIQLALQNDMALAARREFQEESQAHVNDLSLQLIAARAAAAEAEAEVNARTHALSTEQALCSKYQCEMKRIKDEHAATLLRMRYAEEDWELQEDGLCSEATSLRNDLHAVQAELVEVRAHNENAICELRNECSREVHAAESETAGVAETRDKHRVTIAHLKAEIQTLRSNIEQARQARDSCLRTTINDKNIAAAVDKYLASIDNSNNGKDDKQGVPKYKRRRCQNLVRNVMKILLCDYSDTQERTYIPPPPTPMPPPSPPSQLIATIPPPPPLPPPRRISSIFMHPVCSIMVPHDFSQTSSD